MPSKPTYCLQFALEQATDASLASENWALNMEICDIINDTEDGPKDAVKAIRKRLQQNAGKNYTVVMYTLTVNIKFPYISNFIKKKKKKNIF